jgi:RNA-directed DNA polymerase
MQAGRLYYDECMDLGETRQARSFNTLMCPECTPVHPDAKVSSHNPTRTPMSMTPASDKRTGQPNQRTCQPYTANSQHLAHASPLSHHHRHPHSIGANDSHPLVQTVWDFQSGQEIFSSSDLMHHRLVAWDLKEALDNKLSSACYHMRQGMKSLIAKVASLSTPKSFIFKTDIYSYYQSIHHGTLLEGLHNLKVPRSLIRETASYLTRMIWTTRGAMNAATGLPKGGSLSPLLAEVYLTPLDHLLKTASDTRGAFYGRYMDDIIIVATTRNHMRQLKKKLLDALESLRLSLRPEKSFIGRGNKPFSYLGYTIQATRAATRITLAASTIQKTLDKAKRCYARGEGPSLQRYLKRFEVWARSGLSGIGQNLDLAPLQVQLNAVHREISHKDTCTRARVSSLNKDTEYHACDQTKRTTWPEQAKSALRRLEGHGKTGGIPSLACSPWMLTGGSRTNAIRGTHSRYDLGNRDKLGWSKPISTPTDHLQLVWENILCLEGYYL